MALSPHTADIACWVVSDGRRGIENQALGLAEAVRRLRPTAIETVHVARPRLLGARGAPLPERRCDLWIGCGRAALAMATSHKRANRDAFFVYVQDPGRRAAVFDLVVAPEHDDVAPAPNVFPILGSPNRITPQALAAGLEPFQADLDALPHPRAAVLIGGDSKRHKVTPDIAATLVDALGALADGGAGLMVTTSRRTPEALAALLRHELGGRENVRLWSDAADGPNPYFAYLAAADVALATKDSTNMLTEAATAGKPLYLLPMAGSDGKFARLYDALEARGLARRFAGSLEVWETEPLRETDRAAGEIVRRLSPSSA